MRTRDRQWFDSQYADLGSRGKSWGTAEMYLNKLDCLQWCFTTQAIPSTASILDLGCGAGELASLLARNGFPHVDGLDISAVAISRAQLANSGRFQVADFSLPCGLGRKYDCIFDTDCFQMVIGKEKRRSFLANVIGNLKGTGVFLTGVNSTRDGVSPHVVVQEHVQYFWPTTEAYVDEVCEAGLQLVQQRHLPPRNRKHCDRWSELVFKPTGVQPAHA